MFEFVEFDLFSFKGVLFVTSLALIAGLVYVTGGLALYLGIAAIIVVATLSYVFGVGLSRRIMRKIEGKKNAPLRNRRGGR